jgi:hypothetical protein
MKFKIRWLSLFLVAVFNISIAEESISMNDNIGKTITIAITVPPKNEGEKTGIDLNVGVFNEIQGFYYLVNAKGKIKISNEWLLKIKPMSPNIASILGNSELLLPVTQIEFIGVLGEYNTNPTQDKTIKIVD